MHRPNLKLECIAATTTVVAIIVVVEAILVLLFEEYTLYEQNINLSLSVAIFCSLNKFKMDYY